MTGRNGMRPCQNADSKVIPAREVWRQFPLSTNRYRLVGTGPLRKERYS
jgi:hypothetical protein